MTNTTDTRIFEFDSAIFETEFDVSSNPEKENLVAGRMRRAEKHELLSRERMTQIEYREETSTEDRPIIREEAANAWLFDNTGIEVKGYRLRGEPVEAAREFRPLTEELRAAIPGAHKAAFVRGVYNTWKAVYRGEEEGFVLGVPTIPVDLIYGDEENPTFVIHFEIPESKETERQKFNDEATYIVQPRGAKERRSRIVSNLAVQIGFFDELMVRGGAEIAGATAGGRTFAECDNALSRISFLDQIDALLKAKVIGAAMSRYNTKLQD